MHEGRGLAGGIWRRLVSISGCFGGEFPLWAVCGQCYDEGTVG